MLKLPTRPKSEVVNLLDCLILVYGREKIGKTALFAQFPKVLFLTTEPGTKGLPIMEVDCPNWKTVLDAVNSLERLGKEGVKKHYSFVVMDTADRG